MLRRCKGTLWPQLTVFSESESFNGFEYNIQGAPRHEGIGGEEGAVITMNPSSLTFPGALQSDIVALTHRHFVI